MGDLEAAHGLHTQISIATVVPGRPPSLFCPSATNSQS